jgi:uncharacterized protein (TIGR04255 family)
LKRAGATSRSPRCIGQRAGISGCGRHGCDDEVIPLEERIETVGDYADLQEVYDTERCLLYVACTRVRDHLLVTGVDPVSEFVGAFQSRPELDVPRMTNAPVPKLRNPPIVEAVVDVDCDLPPGFDVASLEEAARARFEERYPRARKHFMQEYNVGVVANALPQMPARPTIQALRFLRDDERQLVQVRAQGFSFNRLAPYTTLDDYLPEIERAWGLYVDLVAPVQIRAIRLRYINRILVPMTTGQVDLDEFLKIGPRVPNEEELILSGFLEQQASVERDTGNHINLVLRSLKNRIFANSLTDKCIQLLQS